MNYKFLLFISLLSYLNPFNVSANTDKNFCPSDDLTCSEERIKQRLKRNIKSLGESDQGKLCLVEFEIFDYNPNLNNLALTSQTYRVRIYDHKYNMTNFDGSWDYRGGKSGCAFIAQDKEEKFTINQYSRTGIPCFANTARLGGHDEGVIELTKKFKNKLKISIEKDFSNTKVSCTIPGANWYFRY